MLLYRMQQSVEENPISELLMRYKSTFNDHNWYPQVYSHSHLCIVSFLMQKNHQWLKALNEALFCPCLPCYKNSAQPSLLKVSQRVCFENSAYVSNAAQYPTWVASPKPVTWYQMWHDPQWTALDTCCNPIVFITPDSPSPWQREPVPRFCYASNIGPRTSAVSTWLT